MPMMDHICEAMGEVGSDMQYLIAINLVVELEAEDVLMNIRLEENLEVEGKGGNKL